MVELPDPVSLGGSNRSTTSYTYYAAGQVKTMTDPLVNPENPGTQNPGTRTDYGRLSSFDGRPGFPGRSLRPTTRSKRSTNVVLPKG